MTTHPMLPNMPELVALLGRQLCADEDKDAEAYPLRAPTDTRAVGMIKLTPDEGPALSISVLLSDAYFVPKHGADHCDRPLAAACTTADGAHRVFINSALRACGLDEGRESIAAAILAHEAGHVLAGHTTTNIAPEQRQLTTLRTPEYADLLSRIEEVSDEAYYEAVMGGLLKGGVLPYEVEADRHAAAWVGTEAMLAILARQMALTSSIGGRLEYANRIRHHVEHIHTPDYVPAGARRTRFEWVILDDEQLAAQAGARGSAR